MCIMGIEENIYGKAAPITNTYFREEGQYQTKYRFCCTGSPDTQQGFREPNFH